MIKRGAQGIKLFHFLIGFLILGQWGILAGDLTATYKDDRGTGKTPESIV